MLPWLGFFKEEKNFKEIHDRNGTKNGIKKAGSFLKARRLEQQKMKQKVNNEREKPKAVENRIEKRESA